VAEQRSAALLIGMRIGALESALRRDLDPHIHGTGAVTVGGTKAFLAHLDRTPEQDVFTAAIIWAPEEGTLALVDMVDVAAAMPTRNWSQVQFKGSGEINSAAFQKVHLRKRACTSHGAIGCRNFPVIGEAHGEGPEFETVALCGANCGVGDTEALFHFNLACDDLGMDTISTRPWSGWPPT
jgi:aldehyde:ferredoxin oxidoreductase